MVVSALEFSNNYLKYLELVSKEDVYITLNGKTVAKIVDPQKSAVESIRGLLKGAPENLVLDDVREERLLINEDNV